MSVGFGVLLLSLIAGLTSGYTTRVMARSPEGLAFIHTQNLFLSSMGAIAFPALLSVIVWGFMYLTWWWVVLSFLGVSLLLVPAFFGRRIQRLTLMLKVQPFLDAVTIGSAVFLWIGVAG
jgi:hypothetical protein